MPEAYFRISATSGCVRELSEALSQLSMIRALRRVIPGSCDFYALVHGELSDMIDFKDEILASLTAVVYDSAQEEEIHKSMVHKVEVDLLYGDEDAVSARVAVSPRTLS